MWYIPEVTHVGPAWLLLALLASSGASVPPSPPRERQLFIAGEALAEVHIAAGQPTAVLFDTAPRGDETRVEGTEMPLLVTERGVVVFPSRDLGPGENVVLSVGLRDGTRVRLALVSRPDNADVRVRVHRAPGADSTDDLRTRLERCERAQGSVDAVARYLLEHGSVDGLISSRSIQESPVDFEEGAVIQGAADDHASGISYLLLRLKASRPLSVRQIRLTDASGRELHVLRALPESLSFPANEVRQIVIAYESSAESALPSVHLSVSDGSVLDFSPRDTVPAR